jgi:hypothetical protein
LLHLGFHVKDLATTDDNLPAQVFISDGDMIYELDPDLDMLSKDNDKSEW